MDAIDEKEQIKPILESFYRLHPLSGMVRLYFTVRKLPDSDGQSVIDTYIEALDSHAKEKVEEFKSNKIPSEEQSGLQHLQMLEDSVPPNLLGYEYIIEIEEMPCPAPATCPISIKSIRKVLSTSREKEAPLLEI